MSASMVGMKGRVQKESENIQGICDRIIDYSDLLYRIGDLSFPHRRGRGDVSQYRGPPDRGDKGWTPEADNQYWPRHVEGMDPEQVVQFK